MAQHSNQCNRTSSKSQYLSSNLLPIYPYSSNQNQELCLLSVNTPSHRLTVEQAEQRHIYGYHRRTAIPPIDDNQRQLFFLSRLWNINRDILEWNQMRLMRIIRIIANHRTYHFAIQSNSGYLHEDENAVALEFYLQMDQELFFMKTCGFRGALPPLNEQTIFCLNEPQARYSLTRCNRMTCCLCYPSYQMIHRTNQPLIRFGSEQEHRFIHGYHTILNCPATCETRNLIYALTCPCRKFDYIGETSSSLPVRLSYHQRHGNRIIQEFLIGPKNTMKIRSEMKSIETLIKDNMALYQHSAHCSSAIQWFLDENLEYWPFIPMKMDVQSEQFTVNVTNETDSWTYANDVPKPPLGYHFTIEQKTQIEKFFQEKKYLSSPNLHLDLYQVDFIVILPIHASDNLRHMVESLLITYAQTSLNTDGHLDHQMGFESIDKKSPLIESIIWCENLLRRS